MLQLQELHLAKMEMDDHQFDLLVTHGLMLNCSVIKLNLRANKLTGLSGPTFERLMAQRPAIVGINLANNHMGDDGAAALARCIRVSKSLTDIDLRANQIMDTGLTVLARAVVMAPQLQTMFVWGNSFGNAGSAAFSKAIDDMNAGGSGVCSVDVRPYNVDGRAFVALLDVAVQA